MYVTFKSDSTLNENTGHWIAEGTRVKVNYSKFEPEYFQQQLDKGYLPVIIEEGYDYDGNRVAYDPYTEWFSIGSFHEEV